MHTEIGIFGFGFLFGFGLVFCVYVFQPSFEVRQKIENKTQLRLGEQNFCLLTFTIQSLYGTAFSI